ncbi:MAG TPA: phosphatase PAP2 family protein [Burkholderiaceae bacterium]|nr:phosphatase PAP2 family protein [Burkholderiaceae bacterium]
MQSFDFAVVHYLNGYARHSVVFDRFMTQVLLLPSVKLLPLIACLVWAWFSLSDREKHRQLVLLTVAGAFVAVVVSRLIQDLSPLRQRPLHEATLHFVTPYGVGTDVLAEWSSFPSDHAAIAFALAIGIYWFSRSVGIAGLSWAFIVVCAPRVYAGFHYPSDVLAGAVIGMAATMTAIWIGRDRTWVAYLLRIETTRPPLFYSAMFLMAYEFVTMFNDVRLLARHAVKVLM